MGLGEYSAERDQRNDNEASKIMGHEGLPV